MKTKALIALLLVAILGLASCGVNNNKHESSETTTVAEQEEYTTEEVTSAVVAEPETQVNTTKATTTKVTTTKVTTTKATTTKAPVTQAPTTKPQSLPEADLDAVSNFFDVTKGAYVYVKEAANAAIAYNESGSAADKNNFYNNLSLAKVEFEKARAISKQYSNLQSTTADFDKAINAIDKILTRSYSFDEEFNYLSDLVDSISVITDEIDVILDNLS